MEARKGIVLFFKVLLLASSVYFLYHQVQKIKQKKEYYSDIPAFQLPDINGNVISEADLQKNIPVLFLFFNPDCGMCCEEMEQIQLHQDALSVIKYLSEPV